jgi:SAM-dependent methyltransferase
MDSKDLVNLYDEKYYLESAAGGALINSEFDFRRYSNVFRSHTLALSDSEIICDIGGGRGELAKYYLSLGQQVIYVDYSSAAIRIAQTFIGTEEGIQYLNIDANDLLAHVNANSVDVVFMTDFVEHINQQELLKIISTSYKVLKDGGILVIHTPEKHYGSVITRKAVEPKHINLLDITDMYESLSSVFEYVDAFTWDGISKFYEKGKNIELFGIAVKKGLYTAHPISVSPDFEAISLHSQVGWQQLEFNIAHLVVNGKFLFEGTLTIEGEPGDSIGQFAVEDENGKKAYFREFLLKKSPDKLLNFLQTSQMSLSYESFNYAAIKKLFFRVKNVGSGTSIVKLNSLSIKRLEKTNLNLRKSNMIPSNQADDIFQQIYKENTWKGSESVSGPGSSLKVTELLREQLPTLFQQLNIKTLVDSPCGDVNWFVHMEHKLDLYIGFDIVPEIIARNNEKLHAQLNYFFKTGNIIKDVLPRADAIFCRDCLVHMPFKEIFCSIANFKKSGSKYLIMTTFPEKERQVDSRMGGWRPLNFQIPPFNFEPPIYLIRERVKNQADPYSDKSMGVWELEKINIDLS